VKFCHSGATNRPNQYNLPPRSHLCKASPKSCASPSPSSSLFRQHIYLSLHVHCSPRFATCAQGRDLCRGMKCNSKSVSMSSLCCALNSTPLLTPCNVNSLAEIADSAILVYLPIGLQPVHEYIWTVSRVPAFALLLWLMLQNVVRGCAQRREYQCVRSYNLINTDQTNTLITVSKCRGPAQPSVVTISLSVCSPCPTYGGCTGKLGTPTQ
jgi:hypothetical protein